jgi:hypothetical protein
VADFYRRFQASRWCRSGKIATISTYERKRILQNPARF